MAETAPRKNVTRRFAILATVVVLIAGGWTIGWMYMAGQVRDQIEALANFEPALTCQTTQVGGFPFRFDLDCAHPIVRTGDVTIAAQRLQASALFYRPTHVVAFATGPATIEDAFTGSQRRITWTDLKASIRFNGWRPERISIVTDNATVIDPLFGDMLLADANHLELHLVDAGDADTRGRMRAAGYLKLDQGDFPSLDLKRTNAEIALSLTPLPNDIRAWTQTGILAELVANRAQLTIDQAHLVAEGLNAELSGKLGLDANWQPAGKLTLVSKGLRQRLDPYLQPTIVTAIVGGPDKATGMDSQTFIIKDGEVRAAGLPLFSLPALL